MFYFFLSKMKKTDIVEIDSCKLLSKFLGVESQSNLVKNDNIIIRKNSDNTVI